MNFLTICQRVHNIVGYQGQFTSVNVTGYQATLVAAVKDAYEDIQRYRTDWDWIKAQRDINVVAGTNIYTLDDLWGGVVDSADLSQYRYINYHSPRRVERLIYVDYDAYVLMDFTNWNDKEPRLWSVRPWDKALVISPVDGNYTLEMHYLRDLHELVSNTDEPILPPRHHQLLVYGAIMKLSTFTGDPTLFDTYSTKYAIEMGQLMREENPVKTVRKRPIA